MPKLSITQTAYILKSNNYVCNGNAHLSRTIWLTTLCAWGAFITKSKLPKILIKTFPFRYALTLHICHAAVWQTRCSHRHKSTVNMQTTRQTRAVGADISKENATCAPRIKYGSI